jgi:protein SCO1/2
MTVPRRSLLRGLSLATATGIAGCLGGGNSNPNVVLGEPDRQYESADVPYPAWGERVPDVTVPAPLAGREVSLRAVEKPHLLTFIYTMCPTVCPVLTSTMRNVQTHALNNGYGDQVEFFPLTFDPARDDAERLRAYADEMNIALGAGNWHFLRPESEARAKQVIQEQFGVTFQKQSTTPSDDSEHDEATTDAGHGGRHDHGAYEFVHTGLTLLVNGDQYVERAYRTSAPDAEQIITDLKAVRTA